MKLRITCNAQNCGCSFEVNEKFANAESRIICPNCGAEFGKIPNRALSEMFKQYVIVKNECSKFEDGESCDPFSLQVLSD